VRIVEIFMASPAQGLGEKIVARNGRNENVLLLFLIDSEPFPY